MLARRAVMASANTDSISNGEPSGDVFVTKDSQRSISNEPETVHMLVLETDEPHPETKDRKGSFGQIFHDLFTDAGAEHEPPLKVETSLHYVVDDRYNEHFGHVPAALEIPESTTAILITGSMYDAHSNDAWVLQLLELLKELWNTRPKLLFSGVCFGHQILSRMLGAKVESYSSEKWELAHTEMDLTPISQKLFKSKDKKLYLHQMHQDQVTTKPSSETTDLLNKDVNVHVWASSEHTEIQGLYIRDRLLTSQGHLGFDEKMVHRQIEMRQESGEIKDDEQAAEAKETSHLEHDGKVVAGAILRFFHGDDHDID